MQSPMVTGEGLDEEQRALVASYWWSRAHGEMTSWVAFGHVLDDLVHERAPAALVALAERAVQDEHRHATWCRDWAVRFGHPGGEIEPRSTRPLCLPGATESENRLLRLAFCGFTETVGCVILRAVRPRLSNPELMELNHRHLSDELQHSRVGWGYLATLSDTQKTFLTSRLGELLALLAEACCGGSERDDEALVPHGYFTRRLLRAAHDEALAELILPGLAHLAIRSTT